MLFRSRTLDVSKGDAQPSEVDEPLLVGIHATARTLSRDHTVIELEKQAMGKLPATFDSKSSF